MSKGGVVKRVEKKSSRFSKDEPEGKETDIYDRVDKLKDAYKSSAFYENFNSNNDSNKDFSYAWINKVASIKLLEKDPGKALDLISNSPIFTELEKEYLLYNIDRLEEISNMTARQFSKAAVEYFELED